MKLMPFVFVFLGGGLGSVFRYLISLIYPYKSGFPIATCTANIVACLCLGLLLGYTVAKPIDTNLRLFVLIGFCGGLSTFSTFGGETLKMVQNQQYGLALSYVLLSMLLGLSAICLGLWFIQRSCE